MGSPAAAVCFSIGSQLPRLGCHHLLFIWVSALESPRNKHVHDSVVRGSMLLCSRTLRDVPMPSHSQTLREGPRASLPHTLSEIHVSFCFPEIFSMIGGELISAWQHLGPDPDDSKTSRTLMARNCNLLWVSSLTHLVEDGSYCLGPHLGLWSANLPMASPCGLQIG